MTGWLRLISDAAERNCFMIFDLFRGGFTMELVLKLCARLFVVFCIAPIHEFAHALVAHKLGDDTARLSGRLTVNPLAHIDPIGALMIMLVGFGYLKPVPVNPRNFKNPKGGMALTALAGPVSNLIMALIFTFFFCGMFKFTNVVSGTIAYSIAYFFMYAAQVNISLAVFNFIPVPPLDGSRIISVIIPEKYYFGIMKYERYIVIGVMLLVLVGALDIPMAAASRAISNLFLKLAAAVFRVPLG